MPLFCPLQECSIVKLQSVSPTNPLFRCKPFADLCTSTSRLLLVYLSQSLQLLRGCSCSVPQNGISHVHLSNCRQSRPWYLTSHGNSS